MADYVVVKKDQKEFRLPTLCFSSAEQLKPLLSEQAWQIVKLLKQQAMFPAEIAKRLRLNEQKVYYYIKQLRNAGIIDIAKTEERKGAVAKYFKANFNCFSLVPELKEQKSAQFTAIAAEKEMPAGLKGFLEPFVVDGKLNAKIVVGSPDPHGKYKARARDGHLAVELSAYLGSLCSELNFPLIYLDTMLPNLEKENSNLIIVGGPLTNRFADEINEKLSIQFMPSGGNWLIKSNASGKEYVEDATGFVEKIPHPFFEDRSILVFAGKRNSGTRSAIIALIKNPSELAKPNRFDARLSAKIVEGLDSDSDGIIDDVEIKE